MKPDAKQTGLDGTTRGQGASPAESNPQPFTTEGLAACGLVLEGGGMRGVFTSGVLDCMMDRGLRFPYAVAVSAGACNGLSYVSRQRGRARRSNIELLEKYRYIGVKHLWRCHSLFDLEFMFDHLPNRILPYDYAAYRANPMRFEMVATDCLTGRAVYLHEPADARRLLDICRASSALPYVSPMVWVDGRPMLDGGLADSIPVVHAMEMGYARNVVVLTRARGYRKPERDFKLPRFVYRDYPRLRLLLSRRAAIYNRQLDLVERLEAEGRILVIRPQHPPAVGRMDMNTQRLTQLYEEGYAVAEDVLGRMG